MKSTTFSIKHRRIQSDIASRIDTALTSRVEESGLKFDDLAATLNIDPSTLRAKRRGENKWFFSEIEAIDEYFSVLGLPGFIAEIREQRRWLSQPLSLKDAVLPDVARKLLDCAEGLRAAGTHYDEFLAEKGLLKHVHVLARADDAIRTIRCGSLMASAGHLDRSIIGRDVRSLSDRPYGQFLHSHVFELLERGEPDLRRISSPSMRYTRLSVMAGDLFAAISFDIEVFQKDYLLR